jgi:DNA repair protein RecO (recombination protein O)
MMTKTRAFVLRTIKYGDASLIVDLFTESHGRVSFVVRVTKTKTAKMKPRMFQQMSFLELEFDIRQNVRLQKLRNARIVYPYSTVPFNPFKLSITLFIADFLTHSLKGEQKNEPLFGYVMSSMRWLDCCHSTYSNFHLVFLMRMSRFLGFYPNLENYAENNFFDLRSSCFCTEIPFHSDYLQPIEASKIIIMMRMNYETMYLYTMSHVERNRCIEVMMKYYRLHIPDFPELKSLSVLRDLFS